MPAPYDNDQVDTALEQEIEGDPVTTHDAWDDLAAQLLGKRLSSSVGTADYDYGENAVKFGQGGDITDDKDVVGWNNQKPHGVCADCVFKLHIHWEQDFDGVLSPTWTYQYRVQDNGGMKTTAWTTVSVTSAAGNEVFDRPTATGEVVNQITMLGDIDTSASPLSSTVQFRLTRSDSTTGDVLATFVDSHVNYDQRGSRQEYVK